MKNHVVVYTEKIEGKNRRRMPEINICSWRKKMAKKIILTAILALALVFGMTVVGCGGGGGDGGGGGGELAVGIVTFDDWNNANSSHWDKKHESTITLSPNGYKFLTYSVANYKPKKAGDFVAVDPDTYKWYKNGSLIGSSGSWGTTGFSYRLAVINGTASPGNNVSDKVTVQDGDKIKFECLVYGDVNKTFSVETTIVISGSGSGSGSGGSGSGGSSGGTASLTLSGQVYTYTRTSDKPTGLSNNITYTPYTGNLTTIVSRYDPMGTGSNITIGNGTIQNGQLSYTAGTLSASQLNLYLNQLFSTNFYASSTITPNDVKMTCISLENDTYRLYREDKSISLSGNTSTETTRSVNYMYVDKDCTVTATGKSLGWLVVPNESFSLKKGWNVLYNTSAQTTTTTNKQGVETNTSYSVGSDDASLKWVLLPNKK